MPKKIDVKVERNKLPFSTVWTGSEQKKEKSNFKGHTLGASYKLNKKNNLRRRIENSEQPHFGPRRVF